MKEPWVPEGVLYASPARDYVSYQRTAEIVRQNVCSSSVDVDDVRDTLQVLHRLSLVQCTPADPVRTVRIHNLVQRATRDRFDACSRNELARTVAGALLDVWPDIERDRELAEVLRANAYALHGSTLDALWRPVA